MEDYVGFMEARGLVISRVTPLPAVDMPLSGLAGLVAAGGQTALVASPSVTGSTKDGFAVQSRDLAQASPINPVILRVAGSAFAGQACAGRVEPGAAIRITTGAALPGGADAVLAKEFSQTLPGPNGGELVRCLAKAEPGRNVMPAGNDVAPGEEAVGAGQVFTPGRVGLLAAAGLKSGLAHPRPSVGLLATGREVVAPGQPLPEGALYASNLSALTAWLSLHGMASRSTVVDDNESEIRQSVERLLAGHDALLTSGGAWTSRRDLVVDVLKDMGLDLVFRRVRMGPGKGVAFGLLYGKPVFCLPGGPPSNEMAFLQLALPGVLRLAGWPDPGLAETQTTVAEPLAGQADWTQFWHGRLEQKGESALFRPSPLAGRLKSMAASQGIISLPEGRDSLPPGQPVVMQRLGLAFSRQNLW